LPNWGEGLRPLRPGDRLGVTKDGRPIIVNRDGGVSATKLSAVPDPRVLGRWMNVPTMVDGHQVPEKEARRIIVTNNFFDPETGAAIETFSSVNEAISRSLELAEQRNNDPAVVRAMQELNRRGFSDFDVPGAPGKEPAFVPNGLWGRTAPANGSRPTDL